MTAPACAATCSCPMTRKNSALPTSETPKPPGIMLETFTRVTTAMNANESRIPSVMDTLLKHAYQPAATTVQQATVRRKTPRSRVEFPVNELKLFRNRPSQPRSRRNLKSQTETTTATISPAKNDTGLKL